jgi:hypothetical protein
MYKDEATPLTRDEAIEMISEWVREDHESVCSPLSMHCCCIDLTERILRALDVTDEIPVNDELDSISLEKELHNRDKAREERLTRLKEEDERLKREHSRKYSDDLFKADSYDRDKSHEERRARNTALGR